jgi:hypothetical protein
LISHGRGGQLDVEVPEFEAGMRFIRDMKSNLLYLEIFLADALENGAGLRLVSGPAARVR